MNVIRKRHFIFSRKRARKKRSAQRSGTGSPPVTLSAVICTTVRRILSSVGRGEKHKKTHRSENLKMKQKAGILSVNLILLIAIAMILVAGCTNSTSVSQGETTSTANSQSGPTDTGTAATSITVPTSLKTMLFTPTQAHVSSENRIAFDSISDKKSGDRFTITGTTSLPKDTALFWEIIPDPGIPPTGVNLNAQIGIMANNYVKNGDATSNQVSLEVDTNELKSGTYVVIVASLKSDPATTDPSSGTLAGYTYFTLN